MKISLKSKHLKPGDMIIRCKPIIRQGSVVNSMYLNKAVVVVETGKHHIMVRMLGVTDNILLDFFTWDDGNWTRYKF